MPRAGRELERIAACIEQALGPLGVDVRSPDRMLDRDTGVLREVDVSLRSRVGSSEILVMVEVRDRQRGSDVTWIEQVDSKRRSVGADKVIAVSRAPFTSGAIAKAKSLGIALRRVQDFDARDVTHWLPWTALAAVVPRLRALSIEYGFPDEESRERASALGADDVDLHAKVLLIPGAKRRVSMADIMLGANQELKLVREVPSEATSWPTPTNARDCGIPDNWQGRPEYQVAFRCGAPGMRLHLDGTRINLSYLDYIVLVTTTVYALPIDGGREYSEPASSPPGDSHPARGGDELLGRYVEFSVPDIVAAGTTLRIVRGAGHVVVFRSVDGRDEVMHRQEDA